MDVFSFKLKTDAYDEFGGVVARTYLKQIT